MNQRPLDIVKSSLVPMLWHKKPYLICAVALKNPTLDDKYLFPGAARLEMFGELIAFAQPTFESPGSHRGPTWGTTWEGGGISVADFHLKVRAQRQLYCPFEIDAMALNSLASRFEANGGGAYRVDVELAVVDEYMMDRSRPNGSVVEETLARATEGIYAVVEGRVKNHEWRDWMKAWGAATEAIYLPTALCNELRAIKPIMGVGVEWEVINELLKSYQGAKAEAVLVTAGDELKDKMIEIIAGANKELLIMCRAFDEMLFGAITEAQARGVDIKMITVPTERLKDEKYRDISRLPLALKKASRISAVRANLAQHARVLVSEREALIGSADPDYYGLTVHKNAAVYTTNPTVVNAAKLFFDSVWLESEG